MATKQPKRRIAHNAWGNWIGYVGRDRMHNFGDDEEAAQHWLVTGEFLKPAQK